VDYLVALPDSKDNILTMEKTAVKKYLEKDRKTKEN